MHINGEELSISTNGASPHLLTVPLLQD